VGAHDAPETVGDMPRKRHHADESRVTCLVTEPATPGVAPTTGSRTTTTNGSNGVWPESDLHQRGKRASKWRADSAVLGRGRSLDGPRKALTWGGPTTFA
jgi:hypothetical protein